MSWLVTSACFLVNVPDSSILVAMRGGRMNDAKMLIESRMVYMEYETARTGFAAPTPNVRVKYKSFATDRLTFAMEDPMNFGNCHGLLYASQRV
jgi:hypothetical protein